MRVTEDTVIKLFSKMIIRETLINKENNLFDLNHLTSYSVKKGAVSGMPHATRVGMRGNEDNPSVYIASTTLSDNKGVINAKLICLFRTKDSQFLLHISDSNVELDDSDTITKIDIYKYNPDASKKYSKLDNELQTIAYLYTIFSCSEWISNPRLDLASKEIRDSWFGEPVHMSRDPR